MPQKYKCLFIAILCAKISSVLKSLGLIHTRHFCKQYFDKKIKRHFDKRIFFPSKYCNAISKYIESSQKIFSIHTRKKLDEKCLFTSISFYHNIEISRAKMSSV
jgi:hypothetical protein